jgi:hypothetical protein
VTAQTLRGVRIAVGDTYLHDVRIRLGKRYGPGSVSYLSFHASRHWASVAKERVTISAPAPTVVQLYASGILPPIGSRAIALEMDGQALGEWFLESVESGETSAVDDMIVLQFRRVTEATP